mgnify:FL=1
MIQIYRVGNTNYEKNGDMTLFPTEAYLHVVLNGSWEAAIEHPIDIDGRWKYITEDAVVKMPSFNGNQLFRIKKKEKMDSGISATLEPIFMDAKDDCFLVDVRPTAKNGQQALDILCASNKKYSGVSNITKATTSYYILKNLIEAINGEDENSFIKRWGGEILFNNFQVIVNERVGGDYGVELRYGKNIAKDGLTEEVDIREVVTRIYPKAYNGYMISNNGYVDSPLISNYQTTKTAVITFEDVKMRADAQEEDEEKGIIICDTQQELDAALTEKCRQQYNLGLDKPKVTISADLVLLQNTDLYKDYVVLEQVSLGDTIHCKHNKLGIITDARVIELEYDSIRKKVRSVVLGDFKTDFFDHVSSSTNKIDGVIRPDGTLMGEKVAGILNAINTQLRLQNTIAKKQNVRAILFEDLDPDSALYGAMALGTQGFQIAKKRTEDGRDWQWETAATAEGIVANAVITGILSDKLGLNYWNLDTGEFRLAADAFKVGDETVEDYINGKIDKAHTLTVQLSNEFQGIPTDANGDGGNYSDCYTNVQVFLDSTDITNDKEVTYTVTPDSSITGAWDSNEKRYTVTYLNSDSASVTITVTYSNLQVTKKFSVSKIKQGQPGLNGLQGEKGEQGIPGTNGQDGRTSYFHIKYSAVSNPTSSDQISEVPNTYIGTYVDFNQADSADPAKYTWARFQGLQGENGIPGTNGENGQTSYLHIKYSDDGGITFTANNGETPGKYIGQYVDFIQADSSDPKKYTWSLAKGDDGRVYMLEVSTLVIKQGADDRYSPSNVTFSAFYRDGTNAERISYSGRFVVSETTDGNNYVTKYTSSADQHSITYTPSSSNVKNIRCVLYVAGGTTSALDMQGVAIVRDIDNLTQSEVFNILTNNGKLQGIFMKDGKLYINGSYIAVSDWSELSKTLSGFKLSAKRIYGTDGTYCNGMSIGADNIYCFWAGETNGKLGDGNTDAPFLVSRNGTVWSKRLYAGDCLDLYEEKASWKGNEFDIFRNDCTWNIKQNHHQYGDLKLVLHPWDGETQLVFNWCSQNHGTVYLYGGYNSSTYVGLYHKERNGGAGGTIWRYQTDGNFHIVAKTIAAAIECTTLTQTSSEKIKKDIEELDSDEALSLIKNTKIYSYFLRDQVDEDGSKIEVSKKRQFGTVIERECPDEFVSDDGNSVNLYSLLSATIRVVQKQQEQIERLTGGIE